MHDENGPRASDSPAGSLPRARSPEARPRGGARAPGRRWCRFRGSTSAGDDRQKTRGPDLRGRGLLARREPVVTERVGLRAILQASPLLSSIFSLVELAWVLVSIWALLSCGKAGLPRWAPVAYVAYNVSGWLLGIVLMIMNSRHASAGVPSWAALFGALFGAWFVFASTRLRQAAAIIVSPRPVAP